MNIKPVSTPNGIQLVEVKEHVSFSSIKSSSKGGSWRVHGNMFQPSWYREREQKEVELITPLFDDIKVLSELKRGDYQEGNYQEKVIYDELKTEILDFHYERLNGIRKSTLNRVKELVKQQELLFVI